MYCFVLRSMKASCTKLRGVCSKITEKNRMDLSLWQELSNRYRIAKIGIVIMKMQPRTSHYDFRIARQYSDQYPIATT